MNLVDVEEYRAYDEDAYAKIDPIEYLKPKSNDDYIGKIRNRLQEDAHARKEREKRRRKVLVDQLKANEALEVCFIFVVLLLSVNKVDPNIKSLFKY